MPRTTVRSYTQTRGGKPVQVRRHSKQVPWHQRLLNARGSVDRERLGQLGKGAAASGAGAGIAVLHLAFQVTWAAATVATVLCSAVIWAGGQLLAGGTQHHRRRRGSRTRYRRRRRSKALRWSRRARLAWWRHKQRRYRAGKGTWGQRARYQTRLSRGR